MVMIRIVEAVEVIAEEEAVVVVAVVEVEKVVTLTAAHSFKLLALLCFVHPTLVNIIMQITFNLALFLIFVFLPPLFLFFFNCLLRRIRHLLFLCNQYKYSSSSPISQFIINPIYLFGF